MAARVTLVCVLGTGIALIGWALERGVSGMGTWLPPRGSRDQTPEVTARRSSPSGGWFRGRGVPRSRRSKADDAATLALVVSSLLAAILIDVVAPVTYLMTPLYAVPILVAALRWSPRVVTLTAALVVAINLVSAQLQATPLAVWPFYTSGLVVTAYVAVLLARERQEANRLAREARTLAKEADKQAREAVAARLRLQEFMNLVAHDLATPLTSILGYVQLLLRRTESLPVDSQQQSLLAVEGAAVRMRRLVDDLRDAGRIGVGHFGVQLEPMDLAASIRQVVELQRSTSAKHHILLDAPETLEGSWDRARLDQLIANLVSNAIKYSPDGGEVRVALRRVAGEAVVTVSDQGIGIPPDQQERLFEPFSRLEQGQALPGSGLGLYISKGIVEAHRGRIWVESEIGNGSKFGVALPLGSHPTG
jgi:signal transduction histidine kinase